MSRRIAVLVIFLFVTITVLVSQPKLLWTTTKTNPDSTIQLSDAARDYSGNIYTVTFGGIKYGITLNKYSNVGTLIRETPLSSQITHKYRLAADKGGNAYVVTNDEQKKLTLTKYSPAGDSLWAKKLILSLPQNNYREGNSLIDIDGDGNVYLATEHEQRIPNGIFKTSLMVSSYSPAGQLRWLDTTVKAMPLNREPEYGDMLLGKMMIDQSNNVIISLASRSEINPSLFIAETKIVKYGPNGSGDGNTPHWVSTLAISGVNVEFSDMDVDEMGNIFIAYNHVISLSVGGRIRKYSSSGIAQWDRMTANSGAKLAADNNGGVYAGIGRSLSPTNVIARIFRFNGPESTYVGNFGSGNYSSIYNLAVDKGGYLAVSGVSKPQVFSTEGSFYFFEFTPSGTWNGYAMYASPGVSQEYPSHLFKGNGSYIALGVSGYAQSKAVVWISKIQVAPETPLDPGGNGGGSEPQLSPVLIPSGTTADLHGVWFNTPLDGFIVGDNSTILRTADGGSSWTKQVSPVVSDFQKVRFIDADTGFIIGQSYTLKTTDKGYTWNAVDNFGNQTLYGFDWNDSGVVVAVGSEGTIRRSSDWGTTWQNRSLNNTNATLRDVANFFVKSEPEPGSISKFIACGDKSIIIRSADNGLEWNEINAPTLLGGNFKVIFKDLDGKPRYAYTPLYLIGEIIYGSYTSGHLIQRIPIPPSMITSVNKHDSRNKSNFDLPKKGDEPFGVTLNGEVIKYSALEEGVYIIQKISDKNLNDIYQDHDLAIVVGGNGEIYRLIDGSTIAHPHKNPSPYNVHVFSKQEIIVVQYDQNEYVEEDRLLKTTDAGKSWHYLDPIGYSTIISFPNSNVVWAAKYPTGHDSAYISLNKGESWIRIRIPDSSKNYIQQIERGSGMRTWIVGYFPQDTSWRVYRTDDNGNHWTLQQVFYSRVSLTSADSLSVYAYYNTTIGGSFICHILKSSDGGNSWQSILSSEGRARLLVALTSNDLLFKKNLYESYRSTDGGESWNSILEDWYFINQKNSAYLFKSGGSNNGIPQYSTNGGYSWQLDTEHFFGNNSLAQRVRLGDSTYLVTPRTNALFFSSPLRIQESLAKTPPIFARSSLSKKSPDYNVIINDTINVQQNRVGSNTKKIIVRIDSLLSSSTAVIKITLSHNGIKDTIFYQHDGKNIIFCTLSDNSLNFLNSSRVSGSFSAHYNPYSSLNKFNGSNPSGNWELTVHNAGVHPIELRGWSLIIESDNVTNVKQNGIVPTEFALFQNFPNPFNPTTMINYQLPMNSKVSLKIYDILGREVAILVNEIKNAGTYSTPFNSTRLASGVYFYRIEATSTDGSRNRFVDVKKMMYLK